MLESAKGGRPRGAAEVAGSEGRHAGYARVAEFRDDRARVERAKGGRGGGTAGAGDKEVRGSSDIERGGSEYRSQVEQSRRAEGGRGPEGDEHEGVGRDRRDSSRARSDRHKGQERPPRLDEPDSFLRSLRVRDPEWPDERDRAVYDDRRPAHRRQDFDTDGRPATRPRREDERSSSPVLRDCDDDTHPRRRRSAISPS